MRWLCWHPDRNAILRTAFSLFAILGVVGFLMMYFPFPRLQQSGVSAGFGPEWECSPQPEGVRSA
jgi:hypothetical protein